MSSISEIMKNGGIIHSYGIFVCVFSSYAILWALK